LATFINKCALRSIFLKADFAFVLSEQPQINVNCFVCTAQFLLYECPHKLFDIFLKSYCAKSKLFDAVKGGNYTALNLLVNTYFQLSFALKLFTVLVQ